MFCIHAHTTDEVLQATATEQLTNQHPCSAQTLTAMLSATTKRVRFDERTPTSNPAHENQESLVCCGSQDTQGSSFSCGPQRLTKSCKNTRLDFVDCSCVYLAVREDIQSNKTSVTKDYHIVNSFVLNNGYNLDRFRYKPISICKTSYPPTQGIAVSKKSEIYLIERAHFFLTQQV